MPDINICFCKKKTKHLSKGKAHQSAFLTDVLCPSDWWFEHHQQIHVVLWSGGSKEYDAVSGTFISPTLIKEAIL